MATQKLFAMLSMNSDSVPESNTPEHKWRSMLVNKRANRSCIGDYESLRLDDDSSRSILQQPIEMFHYLRNRNCSVDNAVVATERRASSKSRKSSLKAADSVFLSDSEMSGSSKRLMKQKEIERFYQNRASNLYNPPQSPFKNNVSIEHFQFDLYSTSLTDDQTESDNSSYLSGKVCGELLGYVHYRVEIEQLELKLISVTIDSLKMEKKDTVPRFVRIQLLPHKVDAFISSLSKNEHHCMWNSSWVTNVTFEESQQATAQFLVKTLTKGNYPKSIGVAEIDLKKLDIMNGENFKENIYDGKLVSFDFKFFIISSNSKMLICESLNANQR